MDTKQTQETQAYATTRAEIRGRKKRGRTRTESRPPLKVDNPPDSHPLILTLAMDPKSGIVELEKAGSLPCADDVHQQRLTRRILLKLDTRYVSSDHGASPR